MRRFSKTAGPSTVKDAPIVGAIVLLASIAAASPCSAQTPFDTWTTENGLPQNSVNDIVQTRDGYLWLATFGGLVRFDGLRFVVFDRSVPGIESQRVRALLEDRAGTLWAATEDGMLIRHTDGRFHTFGGDAGLPHVEALRIEEADDGSLWITWAGGAMSRFDGARAVPVRPDHLSPSVAPPPFPYLWDAWWARQENRVNVLVRGRVRSFDLPVELHGARVSGVNADRRGNVWIRIAGDGVLRAGAAAIVRYTTRDGLPTGDLVGTFHEDGSGQIWYWAYTGELFRIAGGTHERMESPAGPFAGTRSLFEDAEGSLWIGTSASGLFRLRQRAITAYTVRDGLSWDGVYSILEDRTGGIWVGTWGGGLNRRMPGGRFRSYGPAQGLPAERITCLFEDRRGRLWVGMHGDGLAWFDGKRFTRHDDPSGLLRGSVWAMHEDRAGTIWFATDAGLVESREGRLRRYTTRDGLAHDRVTSLFEDTRGVLWVGTFRGLSRFEHGAFTSLTETGGFIGNQVRAFHEDADGVIWVGTYDGGLYRFGAEGMTRYTRRDGLHDNGVFQILEDGQGHLWMGSNTGIYRVSRSELNEFAAGRRRSITPVVLGIRSGLASLEVNGGRQPAGVRAADGKLWFPTMGGIAVVDPSDVHVNTRPPRAIVEELRLAGEPVEVAAEIRVPHDAAAFEIHYTAPTFVEPERTRFRYRLIGLDSDWVDAGDRRSVSFYRIPPGRYAFAVTASNQAGAWDGEGARLNVVVLPPFWQTGWFLAAAAGALLALLGGVHETRVRRLRKDHARQRTFSQQLIDSQERERSRVSSEIHDSVGHDLAMVKRHAEAGRRLAADTAVRETLVNISLAAERLDAEIKTIARGLRPYHLDKIGLTRSIQGLVRRVQDSCDIEIDAAVDEIDDLFDAGSHVQVYRIVQEALSNVVKHSGASRARVYIGRTADAVELRVADDGRGLDGAARTDAGGFGLMGMRERARILGGTLDVRSEPGRGTVVLGFFRIKDGRA